MLCFPIDKSEWGYIVKFWSSVLERLFVGTDLRLKWGDTILTMKDISSDSVLKVDLRVLNDKVVQRHNKEVDATVYEAAKNDPGASKYQSDRCKLLLENKVIIDNFLHNTSELDTVYSVQFYGLEMIMPLSLSANGLYVGNEIYHVQLDNNLQRLPIYLQTVLQLLCFRNEAIKVSNVRDNIKSTSTSKETSVKGYRYNKGSSKNINVFLDVGKLDPSPQKRIFSLAHSK